MRILGRLLAAVAQHQAPALKAHFCDACIASDIYPCSVLQERFEFR